MTTLRKWALIALGFTLLGLLSFSIVTTTWLADAKPTPLKYPLVWEMTGAWTFLLLMPLLVAFVRRFPVRRHDAVRRIPLHVLGLVAFGVSHTLLMWASRTAIYRLMGWGRYDYGDMTYRFLMEGQKQLLGYAAVYATVHLLAWARSNRERELATVRLEQQLAAARLSALKMQLNPHFLFNTLNMISSHVYEDPRTADAMIGHLSEFLRLTLRHSDAQEVPLEKELEFLEAYLAIMRARFADRVVVELDVDAGTRRALVPHLVLQPLVENSVTHCMDGSGRSHVRIASRQEDGRLRLSIEDDGPGFPGPLDEALGRGIGLSNTAERLRHLYGADHRFTMDERPGGGLRLRLELPLRLAAAP